MSENRPGRRNSPFDLILPLGGYGVDGNFPSAHIRSFKDAKRMLGLMQERPALVELAASLRRDPTSCFVDIGAAAGAYTLLAASILGPNGKVLAFEPDPESLQALKANIALNLFSPEVRALPYALSDTSGEVTLHTDGLQGQAPSLHADPRIRSSMTVESVRFDDLVDSLVNPDQQIIAKMDVEGAESLVVAGMRKALQDRRIAELFIEHHPDFMTAPFGSSRDKLHSEIEEMGGSYTIPVNRRDTQIVHYTFNR